MSAALEYSYTGKRKDRQSGGLLALGSAAENRKYAVGLVADLRDRGCPEARTWLDGVAIRPTPEELAPFEETRELCRRRVAAGQQPGSDPSPEEGQAADAVEVTSDGDADAESADADVGAPGGPCP